MTSVELTLTTRAPPPRADFGFHIDFRRGGGAASRVFAATHDFIRACERLDRELVMAIDVRIEPVMALEDIETGSLKVWFRILLEATDDQALRDMDWKSIVGEFLVHSKYEILRWINDKEQEDKKGRELADLRHKIERLATGTDVLRLPAYAPVQPSVLIDAVRDFETVKTHLIEGDRATAMLPRAGDVPFDMDRRLDAEALEILATGETQIYTVPRMVLVVRKPDYLGQSRWEFRYGKRSIPAKIEDVEWLARFQSRKVNVRPGDAIKCKVRIEALYDHGNELIAEKFHVESVDKILENRTEQMSFLNKDNGPGD